MDERCLDLTLAGSPCRAPPPPRLLRAATSANLSRRSHLLRHQRFKKKKKAAYSGFHTRGAAAGPAGRRLEISEPLQQSTNTVQHLPELRIVFR
ncbi:hypothetical protein RHGRI_009172 [Rhododendron griersonianum]|uniref:Uncharacterized protein n=1 Tax=Rhododendron griersonianum TaxID=479676 RepID=A0AAV6L436_9ERIC|nr:hypothetical protein RHGRI_009172 [Rhododendron griersonianum]